MSSGTVAVLPAVVGVLWLLVLAAGPEPRHATRFAWFWLALSPLVLLAVPAYLVLGARGAQEGRRRLTGGWAFLLTLVLNGAQEAEGRDLAPLQLRRAAAPTGSSGRG
ncbi:hypothetical protein BJF81_11055 [Ornithinimicrobium sp. CNJ-824]|uniref:hypothetical protein n=1 Tax=Ornithinimicrobium sp. CNJ-824 TaxID=1904966 RepID=UPI000964E8F6|nr:hypothetical protein [Ornithinimicrobium sp. CNJ-824]OLT23438.1 hypothetical protein BJF81_11055 [Ornithinimicrobium sp. CNJ-824]